MENKEGLHALDHQSEVQKNILSEEELKRVTGGACIRNSDGTITLLKGECYRDNNSPFNNTYKILEDYVNVSDNTAIHCTIRWENSGGVVKFDKCTMEAIDFTANSFVFTIIDKF